ncbi:Uncharacterized protein conserved in bacteria [Oceanicola granulosus HTCC2516]|uniref:Uncharacterized protein conserved in bacteria n=2 Tax=Oceanicola granulosus TaxID=252302 RepID=Q2CCA5_OCEGH|nr:Uncharacterized protein conserved in bacteria [Oceanicola granulosus HTCC2516]
MVVGSVLAVLAAQAGAETVLTINGAEPREYTLEQLEEMPQAEYETTNAFVGEPTTFSGPLLRDLLAEDELPEDAEITLRAINDYEVDVPLSDAMTYDVIIATRMDGKHMSVRERGPLWVMYPISDHPELEDSIYSSRLIWQLVAINTE